MVMVVVVVVVVVLASPSSLSVVVQDYRVPAVDHVVGGAPWSGAHRRPTSSLPRTPLREAGTWGWGWGRGWGQLRTLICRKGEAVVGISRHWKKFLSFTFALVAAQALVCVFMVRSAAFVSHMAVSVAGWVHVRVSAAVSGGP